MKRVLRGWLYGGRQNHSADHSKSTVRKDRHTRDTRSFDPTEATTEVKAPVDFDGGAHQREPALSEADPVARPQRAEDRQVAGWVSWAVADLEPARRGRYEFYVDRGEPAAVALEKVRAMPLPQKRFVRAVDQHG